MWDDQRWKHRQQYRCAWKWSVLLAYFTLPKLASLICRENDVITRGFGGTLFSDKPICWCGYDLETMDTQQHLQIIGMVYRNHHVVSHWVFIDGLRVATVKKEVQGQGSVLARSRCHFTDWNLRIYKNFIVKGCGTWCGFVQGWCITRTCNFWWGKWCQKSPRVLRYHPIFEQTHSHPSPNLMVFSKMGPWSFGALLEKLLRHGRSAYKVL